MVHGVRLREGKAEWYRARMVRSTRVSEQLAELLEAYGIVVDVEEAVTPLGMKAVLDQIAPDGHPVAGNGLSTHTGAGTSVSPANKKRRE